MEDGRSHYELSHLGDRRLYDFVKLNQSNNEEAELIVIVALIRNFNTGLSSISLFAENIVS